MSNIELMTKHASQMETLSWAEVNRTHRTRLGVYQKDGRLISLLTDFGQINPCYPDRADASGDTITYTGHGRRGDQHLSPQNRALLAAIETRHTVPLFRKLAVGRWQPLGLWRVYQARHEYDAQEKRMLWRFTLIKQEPEVRSRSQNDNRKANLLFWLLTPDFWLLLYSLSLSAPC